MHFTSSVLAMGEMARRIAEFDWARSALGAREGWDPALTLMVETSLASDTPIILFCGPELVVIYNDAAAPLVGGRHPQALGGPAHETRAAVAPDLAPMLRSVIQEGKTVSVSGQPFHISRRGVSETVQFSLSCSPLRGSSGAVIAVLCVATETTGRIKAQHVRSKVEGRLRSILAQSSIGVALLDVDGRFEQVNDRLCATLGYTSDELLEMHYRDIIHCDPEQDHCRDIPELLTASDASTTEQRCLRKNGTTVWTSNSLAALRDQQGKITQISLVMADITNQRRADAHERWLAAIIASSDDAILSTDLEMRITSWNEGARHLYGYTEAEAVGHLVTMLVPPDRPAEEATIIARIRDGHRVEPHETVRRCKDGRLVQVSLTASPIYDETGRIIGASKIARDISQRKETERLQTILLHEMKHRVKNTLATVLAIARQTLGDIDHEATRTFNARLMALARAQDLMTRDHHDGADLRTLIDEALSPYPPGQISLSGDPLILPPRTVLAFALGLHELATNAAKYGALSVPGGQVAITWQSSPKTGMLFTWREAGGPPVSPPERTGFGSVLIEEILPAEFSGEVSLDFQPGGVLCTLRAPHP